MLAEYPYLGYRVYKVYHKTYDRYMANLVKIDGSGRTTISWAKYVYSVANKRILGDDETVDHIDNNKLNDDISNLQLMSIGDNIRKSAKGLDIVDLVCPVCGESFQRRKALTHLARGRGKKTFCSRECLYESQRKENNTGV